MELFKVFIENQEFVDLVLQEFNGGSVPSAQVVPQGAAVQPVQQKIKPWSAKKVEILQMWKNLRSDTPIIMTPLSDIPSAGEKSTYGEDGIRITGSWYFISSVLARLKEISAYENPGSKLRLIFRGIDKTRDARPDRQSYVFYVNLETRAHGKAGRPRKNTTIAPAPTI